MAFPIYREAPSENMLAQGDLLSAEGVRPALIGHQDYFANATHFEAFAVLTQTCDLQRKFPEEPPAQRGKKKLKERQPVDYIFLAVVRQFSEAYGGRRLLPKKEHDASKREVENLLLHKENRRGLFYLPAETNLGIPYDWVIDLRVMFSVHVIHYDTLLAARVTSMADMYAVALGSAAGYLFNRVAMPEFEHLFPGADRAQHAEDLLKSSAEAQVIKLAALNTEFKGCVFDGCEENPITLRWITLPQSQGISTSETEVPVCQRHASKIDHWSFDADDKVQQLVPDA